MKATSDLDYCVGRSTLSTVMFFGLGSEGEGGTEGCRAAQHRWLVWDGNVATHVQAVGAAVELVMPEPTVRERILQALEDLPPDATFDDAIERLVFLAKIDEGLGELDAGKGIPHDEARRRLRL